MITKQRNPITGARPEERPRPPVLTDAADTSRDAQRIVDRPSMPMENPYGPKNVPAPPNRNFARDQLAGLPSNRGTRPSAQGGQAATAYSVHNDTSLDAEQMAAIGESKATMPKANSSVHSGYPTRGNARKVGRF